MTPQARLTDEQVAEVLRLASGAMEFDRLHRYDRNSIPEMSILSLSLALLQVSDDLSAKEEQCVKAVEAVRKGGAERIAALEADLSAAKAGEEDRLTWLSALGKKLSAAGFKREDESLMGMAEDALKALSALQEKARAVIRHTEGMRLVIGESCDTNERAAVVADVRRLRSLLPEEGR